MSTPVPLAQERPGRLSAEQDAPGTATTPLLAVSDAYPSTAAALLFPGDVDHSIVARRQASGEEFDFNGPPHRLVIFVTISIFMGYACLNALQRNVKAMLGIGDNNSDASHTFGVAVSFL